MATNEHCLYCFESLAANLQERKPLPLSTIQSSYPAYLKAQNPGFSPARDQIRAVDDKYPLFVTWDQQLDDTEPYDLRGCIGTFSSEQPLAACLAEYAVIAALHDSRFQPIRLQELPTLQCAVTLLTNFEEREDIFDWVLGQHGIKIVFMWKNKPYTATYLPSVAEEQNWTKEQTLKSLMRKAGWHGDEDWRTVAHEGRMSIVRYEGLKREVKYEKYRAWREWHKTNCPAA